MSRLIVYGDSISGNCLKVKWTLDHLGIAHEWVETSVLSGETGATQIRGELNIRKLLGNLNSSMFEPEPQRIR